MPGQEHTLINEWQIVKDLARAKESNPEVFAKLGAVLSSMKDPFHAISLLEEGRVLTPSELFLIAHLAFSTSRALSAMEEGRRIPWPKRAVPPSLAAVEKRLLPAQPDNRCFTWWTPTRLNWPR